MPFLPPESTGGISPRLDMLAGDPVDFELFSGSIKEGLQTGVEGVSLLPALWERCSWGLADLSFLARASRHAGVIPRMENSLPSRATRACFSSSFFSSITSAEVLRRGRVHPWADFVPLGDINPPCDLPESQGPARSALGTAGWQR